MDLDHPFHVDPRGRAALTTPADHVRDLVFQVLFTSPGERVNRPDFGCGLRELVFQPNSDALVTATQLLVHGSLQRWLGDLIEVHGVRLERSEGTLLVEVVYARRATRERETAVFRVEREGPA